MITEEKPYRLVTEDEFSALANEVLWSTVHVWSCREGMNVIHSHKNNRDGNHWYPRARGKAMDAVKARVEDFIAYLLDLYRWPDYPRLRDGYSLTMRDDPMNRGHYLVSVWVKKAA